MAHRIEHKVRQQNPEHILGNSIKKINDAVANVTHFVGQRGRTVHTMAVVLHDLFSVKEVQTLAYKLVRHHRLRIIDIQVESGWRDTNNGRACVQ